MFALVFLTLAFVLVPAVDAMAWGPGVHLVAGNYFLANPGCIAPEVARLILNHPGAFLYGCLSADIFIGKGSTFTPRHSHNWSTGQALLKAADSARTRSYAYGYLSHLAADTVAHNHYVPSMLATMPANGRFGHVYVEAQADRMVDWDTHQALKLFKRSQRDTDSVLLKAVHKTRLPFLIKKQFIKGHLTLCGIREWGSSLDAASRLFQVGTTDFFREMLTLSLDAVGDLLAQPDVSPVMTLDPIGSKPLWKVKRQLRRRRRLSVAHAGQFPPCDTLNSLPRLSCQCAATEVPLRKTG